MIKVTFLQDYRGVLTSENFYQAGDTVGLDTAVAQQLAERGIVELVTVTKTVEPVKKPDRPKKKK